MASTRAEVQEPQPNTAPSEGTTGVRLVWIDLIRAGGAFLVVLAHVVLYPALRGSGPLWAQSLYYTASRIAVPLFFMASGFLLLGKQESYGDFFRKRALRVLVPFLVWSLIYLAWNGEFDQARLSLGTVGEGLLRILRGPRAPHLWFFYVLVSLYLFTPVLRIFTLNARMRDLAYFCGLWFVLDPVMNLLRYELGLQVGFEFLFVTGYIGYFVLGHFLARLPISRALVTIAALTAAVAFAFVFYTVYAGQQSPDYDQFFEGYLSVSVVLMTASAFLLTRAYGGAIGRRLQALVQRMSAASLGIYLLHVLVLDLLNMAVVARYGEEGWGSSIWMMPLSAVTGFLICWGVVVLMQRIPVVKYAVP
jgi:surface polysaccharide O-acyltransferase-like enzyme